MREREREREASDGTWVEEGHHSIWVMASRWTLESFSTRTRLSRVENSIAQETFIKLVCNSQFPHKSVNLSFIVLMKDMWTDL